MSVLASSVALVMSYTVRMRICVWFFFFQAEDGIRDLVRSRGLVDVYKRQVRRALLPRRDPVHPVRPRDRVPLPLGGRPARDRPVSYTHLTLPTSDLV